MKKHLKYIPIVLSGLISLLSLLGWIFDIPILYSSMNHIDSMKFSTSISLLNLAISLALLRYTPYKKLGHVFLIFPLFYSINSLVLQQTNIFPNFENLLIHDNLSGINGKMSLSTATVILFSSLSILFFQSQNNFFLVLGNILLPLSFAIDFIGFSSFLFNISIDKKLPFFQSMSLQAVLANILIIYEILRLREDYGISKFIHSGRIGSRLTIFLSLALGITTLFITSIRVYSHKHQLVDVEFGILLVAISIFFSSILILLITGIKINSLDEKRESAELELKRYNENLESVIDEKTKTLLETQIFQKDILISAPNGIIKLKVQEIEESSKIYFIWEYINPAAQKILGFTEEMLLGKYVHEVMNDFSVNNLYKSFLNVYQTGKSISLEYNYSYFNKNIWLNISVVKSQSSLIINIVDITESYIQQNELKKAKLDAESALEAKSGFLAAMSHEIRTPLNGVIGMGELLSHTNLNPEQKEYVQNLNISSELLMSILNDILDYSKLDSNKMLLHFESVNIRDCICECIELFTLKITEKKFHVYFDCALDVPEFIRTDQFRIKQILNNLFGNALKFTNTNGEIILRIRTSEENENKFLLFQIEDNGIGIPDDKQEKLFSLFTQVDSSTTKSYGGTGLGLAISKKIVLQMQGEIWLESKWNQGSSFYFKIPLIPIGENHSDYLKERHENPGSKLAYFLGSDKNYEILKSYLDLWKVEFIHSSDPSEISIRENSEIYLLVELDFDSKNSNSFLELDAIRNNQVQLIFLNPQFNKTLRETISQKTGVYDLLLPIRMNLLYSILFTEKEGLEFNRSLKKKDSENYSAIKGKKVLLVEDHAMNQKLAIRFMEKWGVIPEIADNGKIAVEKVTANKYDLILMDIHMPEMDGIEATRTIQSQIENPPPIVIMSADVFKKENHKDSKIYISDFVLKPFKSSDIRDIFIKYKIIN